MSKTKSPLRLIALAPLAVALAACATPQCPGATEPPTAFAPASNPYEGTSWVFDSAGQNRPTIQFEAGRAGGNGGCNRWFGTVEAGAHGALTFSSVGATRMACAPPAMQIEQNFLGILRRTRAAEIRDNLLVLKDEAGADLATFSPQP